MKRLALICTCCFLTAGVLIARDAPEKVGPEADAQFEQAYELLVNADDARERRDAEEAERLYREALSRYAALSARYPTWQSAVVKFRIAYCSDQLERMTRRQRAAGPEPSPAPASPPPAPTPEAPPTAPAAVPGPALPPVVRNPDAVRASLLLRAGETDVARTFLLEALRNNPDDADVRLLMGIAQCRAGLFDDAVFVLEQLAADLPEHPYAHLALGAALTGAGRLTEAIQALNRALALQPDLGEGHFDLAQLLLETTPPDLEAARTHYRRALDLGIPPDAALEALLQSKP